MITLGGGDYSPFLPYVAQCVADSPFAESELLVLQGGTLAETITTIFSSHSLAATVLAPSSDFVSLLLDVDLCITAGGSTCWELCCLGIPFLILQIAENQKYVVSNLVNASITEVLTPESLMRLYEDGGDKKIRSRLMEYVDGEGAGRTIKAMVQSMLDICSVTQDECWDIYSLSNDPEARKYSLSSKNISRDEHELWFSDRLKKTNEPFWIGRVHGRGIAYARLDAYRDGLIVSIAVAKEFRGLGVGTTLLKQAVQGARDMLSLNIYASIHKANYASQKMFQAIGFVRITNLQAHGSVESDFFLYRYKEKN